MSICSRNCATCMMTMGLLPTATPKGAAVQQLYNNLQMRKATVEDALRFLLGYLQDPQEAKKYVAAFGVDMAADGKEGGVNELALFAGAGGGILGSELLGIRTVCAVELEPYPSSVLLARQNDGLLPPFPVWDDVRTFDGRRWRGLVDVVSGGFPCQDISAAGKGAGIDGARSGLWREMHRIINEVRPEFAFLENSPLLVGRGLARILGDLARIGYDAAWCVLGADAVGLPHRRARLWLLAHHACMYRQIWTVLEESGGRQTKGGIWKITWHISMSGAVGSESGGMCVSASFAALMMGWPQKWTDLKPLATGKFLQWRQLHSGFYSNDSRTTTPN